MADGVSRAQRRRVVLISGGIAGAVGLIGAWIGAKLLARGVRTAGRLTRYGLAVVTFRLYRRCPDCKGVIRSDARVCRHCGYRRPPRPPKGRRARRRHAAAAA